MVHVETDTVTLSSVSHGARTSLDEKDRRGIIILMLSGLEPKTRVRTRDDDRTPCEAGCRHSRHLEDLAVEELIDFGESGHFLWGWLRELGNSITDKKR